MLTAFMPPPAVLILAPTTWPRWAIMWALAVIIYAGWRTCMETSRVPCGVART